MTEPGKKSLVESGGPARVAEHFVDGVKHIGLIGGVVRVEFAHLISGAGSDPILEPNVRLVSSLEGFVSTYQTMQRMVERLAAQGKLALAPGPRLREDQPIK